jgi:hypothetical protein
MISILQAMQDQNVFGPHFKDARSWQGWTAFLAASFGLPMNPTQARLP